MDAQQFLAAFGHVANAPGGIAQLRQMIYQLSVTGALTPRGDNNEDAGALLAAIEKNRQRLIKENKYKRLPKLESEPIRPSEGIALPPRWKWSRLLDVGEINPRNDAPDDAIAAFVPMSGVPQQHGGAIVAQTKRWGDIKKAFTHFANGDVVLAKITPCFENGKAAIVTGLPGDSGIGAGTTELQVFRPIHAGILPAYVYLFLRSPLFVAVGERNMTGTAGQKRLPADYFATCPFPLAPTEEQARIVRSVDELMALCDHLEAQQQKRRTLQNALRHSTLQAAADAKRADELEITWARIEASFGLLFGAPEDVEDLKGLVLDFAVRGLLLPSARNQAQDSEGLLDAIAAARKQWSGTADSREQREALSMLRKLRTQSVEPPHSSLPEHWRWASLLQISKVIIDCDHKTPVYSTQGIHLIRTTDIRSGLMRLGATKKVSEESYIQRSRRLCPEPGDIFFTREAPMGEAALVPEGARVCLGQRLMLIRLFPALFNSQYLLYVIRSPGFQKRLLDSAVGMTVKHINVDDVENLMIPVPPKQEQDRIVDVIDRLFLLCERYARRLARVQSAGSGLASSAVASLTGITVDRPEDEVVKPPQTELIAMLRLGQPPGIKSQAPLATLLARHRGEMDARDLWQRFGGEIDAFYSQLKTEVAQGWIQQPAVAEVREKNSATGA